MTPYSLFLLASVGVVVATLGSSGCSPSTSEDVAATRSREVTFVRLPFAERQDCQIAGAAEGKSSVMPPFEARCARGPGKQCVRAAAPTEVWEFAFPADDPAWKEWAELGYPEPTKTHFHHQFSWGFLRGACRFTAAAFGDLDDDGIYSTYEEIQTYSEGKRMPLQINERNEE